MTALQVPDISKFYFECIHFAEAAKEYSVRVAAAIDSAVTGSAAGDECFVGAGRIFASWSLYSAGN
jgi:hypothetical protein